MFLTLEGIEGAGKSTQARLLAERLVASGRQTWLTHEPGGTPLAGAIRALLLHPQASLDALAGASLAPGDAPAEEMLPLTEALLLSAARAQHVPAIRTHLAAGEIVISDRYADATRAYQGSARGCDMTTILTLEDMATDGLRPDLTLLLDLPA
ncbi:MAG TPA: dTMP kinase, partial [Ktedonobacterales bacterium]|nr:dTMP kinase [Ktedonobacterales bacterium]